MLASGTGSAKHTRGARHEPQSRHLDAHHRVVGYMVPARLQAETAGALGFVAMVMENVEFWTEEDGSDMALDA